MRIVLLLFPFCFAHAHSVCPRDLGVCLRPLVDTWEHIRNIEDHAADLIFPLPFYRRNSTLVLCEQYDTIRKKCFSDSWVNYRTCDIMLLKKRLNQNAGQVIRTTFSSCGTSPMMTFIKQQLGYFCGSLLPVYMKKHDCTSSTLLRNRQCLRHLHGMPNPLVSSDRCNSFMDFYNCIESFLDKKCGKESVTLFGGAIKNIGCSLDAGALLDEDLKLLNSSGTYTEKALTSFLETSRPVNFLDLLTSAETIATLVSKTPVDSTEASASINKGSDQDWESTENVEATTEIVSETTWSVENEVKRDDNSSRDQELNNSSDRMAKNMSTKATEEHETEELFEATTEIINQPDVLLDDGQILFLDVNSTEHTPFSTTSEELEVTTEGLSSSTSATCSQEDEDYVTACHSHLLRIPLREVQHLCKMYDEGNKCASDQLPKCEYMQLMRLVNSQLEAVCFRIESMFREYQCMLDTFRENPKCTEYIKGIVDEEEACKGQQEAYECFTSSLSCHQGALILVREMVRGHGCRVDLKRGCFEQKWYNLSGWLTKPPTTTPSATTSSDVETTIKVIETTEEAPKLQIPEKIRKAPKIRQRLAATTESPPLPTTQAEETTSATTSAPAQWFGTCSPRNRKIARTCMGPLLRTWDGLRKRRLQLRRSQFPIYRYTKTELLELCDGYANSFLCAGHDTIRYCLNDELVAFAQGHLGYQCSPQNLQRFLTHYDCITEVEETSECREFASGEALSGKREICREIEKYAECMTPRVEKQCSVNGLTEFQRTILQYGCKNVKHGQ